MSPANKPSEIHANHDSRADQPGKKRPYLKPAFAHEQIFETMALSCGKITGTQGACNQIRKLS